MVNQPNMRISLVGPIGPTVQPSTKTEWAIAIGLAIMFLYMLGYMISTCLRQ